MRIIKTLLYGEVTRGNVYYYTNTCEEKLLNFHHRHRRYNWNTKMIISIMTASVKGFSLSGFDTIYRVPKRILNKKTSFKSGLLQ